MPSLFRKSIHSRKSSTAHRFSSAARMRSPREHTPAWQWLKIDQKIAIITFMLLCFGLVFTYSSSAFDSTAYFKRQLVFDIVGIMAALFLSQTYTKLQSLIKPIWLMYITWILLIVVLFTKPIANVHRWIHLGFFNLQPSEVAKVTLVIYVAHYLSQVQGKLSRNWKLLLNPLVVSGITFILMMRAPDLGTPMLMGTVLVMMLYAAGARLLHLGILATATVPVILYQLIFYTYRLKRVLSFLNPEAQASGDGFQLWRSFWAVGSGGWFGKGLGNSELKLEYLPAAHTDFIFSIMSEELGLIRLVFIIVLFCVLLGRGIGLARIAKNSFHSLLIFGLTTTICGQAFFNMAMAIGLVPTKGIPLPFFSYGGSSVIMTLVMIGIICNVAAQSAGTKTNYTDNFTDYRSRNFK